MASELEVKSESKLLIQSEHCLKNYVKLIFSIFYGESFHNASMELFKIKDNSEFRKLRYFFVHLANSLTQYKYLLKF